MTGVTWLDRFEDLSSLPGDIRETLLDKSAVIRAPEHHVIFGPGKSPENFLLLLAGTVRVQQTSEAGREIVLYRVEAGQSCVLTTACLLAHEEYSAEGIAETEVEAVAIPAATFDRLIADSEAFRNFVFAVYAKRITNLFRVIDDVAFGRIDVRLSDRLITLARHGRNVRATHQQLATELGTAREVISRQLTEFQRRGWISQTRGQITLQNAPALQSLSRG